MYKSTYDKYLGKYVRVHFQNGSATGKLENINFEEHAFDLGKVISFEPGKKASEIALTNSTFYFDSIIGMTEISPKHYRRLKQPQSIAKYLGKPVCIDCGGKYIYGNLSRISSDSVELLPFFHAKLKNKKTITYIEKSNPFVLFLKSINSIMPSTKKTLAELIKNNNKPVTNS